MVVGNPDDDGDGRAGVAAGDFDSDGDVDVYIGFGIIGNSANPMCTGDDGNQISSCEHQPMPNRWLLRIQNVLHCPYRRHYYPCDGRVFGRERDMELWEGTSGGNFERELGYTVDDNGSVKY